MPSLRPTGRVRDDLVQDPHHPGEHHDDSDQEEQSPEKPPGGPHTAPGDDPPDPADPATDEDDGRYPPEETDSVLDSVPSADQLHLTRA